MNQPLNYRSETAEIDRRSAEYIEAVHRAARFGMTLGLVVMTVLGGIFAAAWHLDGHYAHQDLVNQERLTR